jgi:excisionase family DNA binding protein
MLTQEERQKIKELLNAGLSIREIAKRLGVSKGAVEYYSREQKNLTLLDIEILLEHIKDLLIELNLKVEEAILNNAVEKSSLEGVSQDSIKTEKTYTVKEASGLLGVSDRAIQYWCENGKMRATRIGKKWLIPESEIKKMSEKLRGLKDAIQRPRDEASI